MRNVINICLWMLLSPSGIYAENSHHVQKAQDDHGNTYQTDDIDTANTIYIAQKDILSGTFRITEPGYYVISEDLRFNFNAPTNDDLSDELWSANNYDADSLSWFPATDDEDYQAFDDLYSLGFFAGITIECNDVTIDLNGHNIEMDYAFYLQQRFFSLIELGNRQFIVGHGLYSSNIEVYPSNIEIKNGLLGLTSHHAIHGNNVNILTISDVTMHNFDIAGFACNGCKSVAMSNSFIGPQNTNIPVLGRYTHARALLPRLRDFADTYGTEQVQFAGRDSTTVNSLIDRLISQMDMVYNHIVNSQVYEADNEEWMAATQLFINTEGYLDGSSAYGLVFNGQGVSTSAIGTYPHGTNDIVLTSVEIQGIYLKSKEKFKLTDNDGVTVQLIFGDTIDCLAVFDQIDDVTSTQYTGDAYTDLMFAMDKYITDNSGIQINDGLRDLVFNGNNDLFSETFNIYGSTDIQLQSMKGAIGIRIDGVSNFKIQASSIHDIENFGVLGSKLAGEYVYPSIANEDEDIQYGYTGSRAQGLMVVSGVGTVNNLEIYDINSHSGSAHAVIVYDGSTVGATNIRSRNIQAGSQMTQSHIDRLTLPNYVPLSCSVEVRGDSSIYSTVDRDDLGDVTGHFIIGYDLCANDIGQCEWCYNRNANEDGNAANDLVEIPSDCTYLEDGLQYILPDEEIGTVIPVTCDNGWTMLDGSLTPNIYDYFTSYAISHRDNTVILPNTDDHTSWREWYIPANENTLFRVAITCDECVADDNEDTMWGDNTAYYATGDYLCFYIRKIDNLCSISDIYCNACDDLNMKTYDQPYDDNDDDSGTYEMWEQCKYVRYNSDVVSNPDHYYCTHREPFVWPALGKAGEGCTCYKPTLEDSTTYTITLAQAVDQFETTENEAFVQLEESSEYLYVELTQNDFLEGTYRIVNPGTYVITEDILFDFNAPPQDIQDSEDFSPNSFYGDDSDVWWWPRKDQESDYPGASQFYLPYTLGYFAGISIECSDVVIDLNGHSLAMSDTFYLQQRFFSLIEMGNRPFAPGKGAANWGWIERYASNVIIKNGDLGLSSHHCVHGNFLNNVLVQNVQMSQFDVAGFGCGQCIKVTLSNLDIGPQHQQIPVLGRYTHARAALPRFQYLSDNYGDWVVPFWDRQPTINDLIDRLTNQMDMVYDYVINGVEIESGADEDDYNEWLEAKKLFINEAGYQDASASYGIVFAGGAAVSAIGTRIENEGDILIENVKVHGLRSHVMEKYKVYGAGSTVTMRGFFRDTFDWEAMTDDFSDLDTAKYIGNAYEDIMMAIVLNEDISSEWSFLYTTQIEEYIREWVVTGDGSAETGTDLERWLDVHCGTDIQVHSVKGVIGVRVDGATNLQIDGLEISDLVSTTPLGSMRCGEYDAPMIAGEEAYIQPGYNGHRVHGLTTVYTQGSISNLNIYDLTSLYGNVYGLRVFDGCDINLNGDINVNNLNAGIIFEQNQIDMTFMLKSTTNPLPESCGVYLYSDPDNLNYDEATTNILSQNIVGYKDCDGQNVIREDQNDFFISQSIGECVNCITKDIYTYSEKSADSNIVPVHVIILSFLIFVIFSIYAIYKYKYGSHTSKFDSQSASESTPLLKS